jgi:hypothetical protein
VAIVGFCPHCGSEVGADAEMPKVEKKPKVPKVDPRQMEIKERV